MPANTADFPAKPDLERLLHASPCVHYLASLDAGGNFTFVSDSVHAHTGFPAASLTDGSGFWLRRIHPDDRRRVLARLKEIRKTPSVVLEYRVKYADDRWHWVHDSASLVKDAHDVPLAISGAWLDITLRKTAEAALQHATAFAESVIQNAPTIVLLLDAHGVITKVNHYFEVKTGYAATDVVGKNWLSRFIPEEEQPAIAELFDKVVAAGRNSGHVNTIVAKDGTRHKIEWFAEVLRDADGTFNGLLNIGHDVTERLIHEQALEQAKREAESANSAKTRFLATASHDLRQPLQTLLLLNSSLRKLVTEPRKKHIVEMQSDALAVMGGLLNGLLDIAKLEAGAVHPEIADVPVQDMFRQIRAEFDAPAHEKGLELDIRDCPYALRTDPNLFGQLLQNVVANAIRYTQQGFVRVECAQEDDALRVSVEDSGVGIRVDQYEAIFDEFYQLEKRPKAAGFGLGLSIVKRIAALLGVRIEVKSEVGKGSSFTFTVAQGRMPQTAGAHDARPQKHAFAGSVLLVDDDAAVLAASRLFLELEGFDVIPAGTPKEAEALAADKPIDLIITDYQLSGTETGLDVIRSLRDRSGKEIPAIIATGDTSPAVGATNLAALRVLSKPIDTTQLLNIAHKLLERR